MRKGGGMSADDLRGLLPIVDAASALSVPAGTLRRWIREGCPHVPGRRGRGCATLVDVQAVKQWRQANDRDALLQELAAALPDVLAAASVESWRLAEGIDKRKLAGITAATWYVCTSAVLDHLREQCPAVPELARLPDEIERLRKIAHQ